MRSQKQTGYVIYCGFELWFLRYRTCNRRFWGCKILSFFNGKIDSEGL